MDTVLLAFMVRNPDGLTLLAAQEECQDVGMDVSSQALHTGMRRLMLDGFATVLRRADPLRAGPVLRVYGLTVEGKAEAGMRTGLLVSLLGADIPVIPPPAPDVPLLVETAL